MAPAKTIRNAVAQVSRLRDAALVRPELGAAVSRVKQFQSRRFASTYADLIADPRYRAATRFFLDELYGDTSYAERDAQFSRVAGAIQRLLPEQAVKTAVALAELHALSEQLDQALGVAWLGSHVAANTDETSRYIEAWRLVGCRADRDTQLRIVMDIGAELERLTRTTGLRVMLRMMRGPAHAAGLGALQSFLEAGFDTFASMSNHGPGSKGFLAIIRQRESRLIELLFDADFASCHDEISRLLVSV